jgi:beta-N-acetylhexosaminidase
MRDVWQRTSFVVLVAASAVIAGCACPFAPPRGTATTAACSNAALLTTWSATRLAEQTIVIPVSEGDVASITSEIAAGAGGVILFGSSAPVSLGADLRQLDASAPGGIAPFVMTDEEGGAVQRMANLAGSIPSAREMAATMSPAQIRATAAALAERMRAAGITMDLAPVLDLDDGVGPNDRDPDGTRSFGLDPNTVAADGGAFAAGLAAGGIIPVVKHFPGLGQATANTDVRPAATLALHTLEERGLVPFEAAIAAGAPAVMVANASVPGLSALPASVSPAVITGLLRGTLGFHGLVITDSLSSGALVDSGYPLTRAVVAALAAGADMVLYTATASRTASITRSVVAAVVAAVASGALSRSRLENAVDHILSVKHVDLCSRP